MTNITISEYGYIGCDNFITSKEKFVSKRDLIKEEFQELYNFWLKDKETQKVFKFENQKCLKAQNYVGVIQTQNLSIEILPKIYNGENKDKVRTIFIEMLKVVLNINEIQINQANLSVTKNKNIYEMFIAMFVKSIDILIHKGIKSSYILEDSNQHFLKGKLKFNEHIKHNVVHKEKFYVEFDEYMPNRVENKLLKSTIQFLLKKTKDYLNKKALKQQLLIFDNVHYSHNHKIDISKINLHRGMEYYELPLKFAKIFLEHNSFTSLRGKENVFALLFPMEKLFEEYMEYVLKNSKNLGIKEVLVNGGKNEYLLSNKTCSMARLQPDYLLKMLDNKDIIVDAKWKILTVNENNSKDCTTINISSNDIYQIFSYLHFYDSQETAYLFVPNLEINKIEILCYQNQLDKIDKKIKIIPIDLEDIIQNKHILNRSIFDINVSE